tara:strand:+ start:3733 stop:4002 length:270 start_codon:yes stop_codon:yes gene_type:complete
MSTRTRSGRIVKNPKVFIPAETVLDDDYCTEDHDDTDTDCESDIARDDEYRSSSDDDSEDDEDDDEVDEDGNLKDFIDDASEESESDDA